MILTKDDREKVYHAWQNSSTALNEDGLIQMVESALLEKLRGGVELPEPEYLNVQLTTDHEHGYAPIVRHIDAYSADQLLKYGAAQRLAGRERETCTWTEQDDSNLPGVYATGCGGMFVLNEGKLQDHGFSYCPYCGNEIALAASPQEQT